MNIPAPVNSSCKNRQVILLYIGAITDTQSPIRQAIPQNSMWEEYTAQSHVSWNNQSRLYKNTKYKAKYICQINYSITTNMRQLTTVTLLRRELSFHAIV